MGRERERERVSRKAGKHGEEETLSEKRYTFVSTIDRTNGNYFCPYE